MANGTTVASGGVQQVESGATASGTMLSGSETVFSSGTASATTIYSGGSETVNAGGTDTAAQIDGGMQIVSGTASGATINAGEQQLAGAATGTTVDSSGIQFINGTSAVASGTIINDGGTQTINFGSAVATTINNGGFEDDNGTTISTMISSGGQETVESGGTASATIVGNGGSASLDGSAVGMVVSSGIAQLAGSVVGLIVEAGGSATIYGSATGVTISGGFFDIGFGSGSLGSGPVTFAGQGGVLQDENTTIPTNVISGFTAGDWIDLAGVGFASNGTVQLTSGNLLQVVESGTTYDVQFNSSQNFAANTFHIAPDGNAISTHGPAGTRIGYGQILVVPSGHTVSNVSVTDGNVQDVIGTASNTTVQSGGEEDVFGKASGIAVSSGGIIVVESGGSALSATIADDGFEFVYAGGTTISTAVGTGTFQEVYASGTAIGTTISNNGEQDVQSGGVASGAVIGDLGLQQVFSGGTAVSTTISNGGQQFLYGIASGTVISNGGLQEILSGGDNGVTVDSGGLLEIFGGTSATGLIISGGLAELGSGGSLGSGPVTFAGADGTLLLADTAMPANVISGFAPGDRFDLAVVPFVSGGSATLLAGNVLQVVESGATYDLNLNPSQNFAGQTFYLSPDRTIGNPPGTDVDLGQIATVSSAQTVSNASVTDGNQQAVFGSAVGTTVSNGGEQEVHGTATRTTLNGSALQLVYGAATSTTINGGGFQFVSSGGTATSTTVASDGVEEILGTALSTTIASGGSAYVASGGNASAATISGGVLELGVGGSAGSGAIIFAGSGGFLQVDDTTMPTNVISGFAPGDSIFLAGVQDVEFGGLTLLPGNVLQLILRAQSYDFQFDPAQNFTGQQFSISNFGQLFAFETLITLSGSAATMVSSGETLKVSSGQTSNGVIVLSGGTLEVLSGGTASGTVVSSGGTLEELSGSLVSGTTLSSGSFLEIASGYSLSNYQTSGGVTLEVGGGGTVSGATVSSGYTLDVLEGGTLVGSVVDNGTLNYDIAGSATFSGTLTGAGTLVVSGGGHLTVTSAYTGAAQIDDTSTLEFSGAYVGGATFSGAPTGPGGTLKLDVPSTGPIIVVNSNDTVVAQPGGNDWINATVSYTLSANVDALFLYAGSQGTGNSDASGDALYALDGNHAQTLTGNSANDTFVVYNSSDVVVPKAGSHDTVYAAASYTLPTGVDVLFLEAGTQGVGNSDAAGDALWAANPGQVATLTGNSANDTFVVYNSADVVVPKTGSHDSVYSAVSYTLPTGVDVLFLEAGTQGVGNSDAASDTLWAADAGIAQTLTGNSTNDTFVVYNSSDVVVPKTGSHDTVYSAVNYTLPTGVDVLLLEAGTQAAGNSDATGDTLYAADIGITQTLTGNSANDSFVVYNSADVVIGQSGSTDKVYAAANFTLPTNVDTLFLENNASHGTGNNDAVDALFGNGSVASTLVAGSGADTLYVTGTAGTILTGGAGHDTFAFPNVMGKDEVTNFGLAKDTLQFNMTLFSNFTAAMNHASQSGANTVFTVDTNDTVTLDFVTKTCLTAGNFHFT